MLYKMKAVVIILSVYCRLVLCQQSVIMTTFSESIGNAAVECKQEIQFGNDIIREFLSFWDPKYMLRNKNVGCVVLCITYKLQLLDKQGNLRIANAQAFGKSIGSDDSTTNRLISLYQLCKSNIQPMATECKTLFELTRCFRYGIFQLHWAPDNPLIH